MAKFVKGIVAAIKQLSKSLTLTDIAKIEIALAFPSRIIELVIFISNPGVLVHNTLITLYYML